MYRGEVLRPLEGHETEASRQFQSQGWWDLAAVSELLRYPPDSPNPFLSALRERHRNRTLSLP